jgi:hypothetical protein
VRIFSVKDWDALDVGLGSVVCIVGFRVFRSAVGRAPRVVAVGEGRIEVEWELETESLRMLVQRGVSGYRRSAEEGLPPRFAPLRVCGLRRESGRVVKGGSAGEMLPQGRSVSPEAGLLGGGPGEADIWYGRAMSAVSLAEAAMCFEKAAGLGHIESMCHLGEQLLSGEGVPVDKGAAFAWTLKAAELGRAAAMYNVGVS